jgi:anti-sigma28 factor (negative regulator of flagellin synthesis)
MPIRRRTRTERNDTDHTVQSSLDDQLMAAALKAATNAPTVRVDVVEAMKRKLAAGEIGNDSGRLADCLIEALLRK